MSDKQSPVVNELLRDLAGAIEALDRFEANAITAARNGANDSEVNRHLALINAHTNGIAALARLLVQQSGHAAERIKRNDLFMRLH